MIEYKNLILASKNTLTDYCERVFYKNQIRKPMTIKVLGSITCVLPVQTGLQKRICLNF